MNGSVEDTTLGAVSLSRKLRRRTGLSVMPRRATTVSVVIPCYNYATYLPTCVGSVLQQAGVTTEVIIVDDASTDGADQVAAMLAQDCRVRLRRHSVNRGPVATFNDGMEMATGEFLVRLDADDALTPGALARAVAAAEDFPSVGLIYGRPRHFQGEEPRQLQRHVSAWTVWPGREWLAARCRDGFNVITSPEVVMRRSIAMQVGGQRELRHAHDMEMWFRLSAFSDVLYIHGPDQALHRDHADSLSTKLDDPLDELTERRSAFDVLFDGAVGAVEGAERMRKASRIALARQAVRSAAHEFDRGRARPDQTSDFLAFARQTWPNIDGTAEWRRLARRVELGPAVVSRKPRYRLVAAGRRVRDNTRRAIWLRRGTYNGR